MSTVAEIESAIKKLTPPELRCIGNGVAELCEAWESGKIYLTLATSPQPAV
jgi:hypothetical protein